MTEKHHHHTVPEFYLKGFRIPTDPAFIWEYQRKGFFKPGHRADRHNPVKRALRKASVIIDYYGTIEDNLAKREEAAKPIIQKIRTSEANPRITPEEKEQLSDYIGLMIKRTPARDQRTPQAWKNTVKNMNWDRLRRELADAGRFRDAMRIDVIKAEYEAGMPEEVRQASILMPYDRVRTRIIELSWQFLTTSEPAFLTSDNPVRFPEQEGLGHDLAFLLFPISSTITLLASTQEFATLFKMPTGPDRTTSTVTSEQIATLNHLTITGAQKYVYYHDATRWITESFA